VYLASVKEEPVEAYATYNNVPPSSDIVDRARPITSYDGDVTKEDGGSETDDYEFRILDVESTSAQQKNLSKSFRQPTTQTPNFTKTKQLNGHIRVEMKKRKQNRIVVKLIVKEKKKLLKNKTNKVKERVLIKKLARSTDFVVHAEVDGATNNEIMESSTKSQNIGKPPRGRPPGLDSARTWPPLIKPTKYMSKTLSPKGKKKLICLNKCRESVITKLPFTTMFD